jgi:hypothetical protein
MSLLLTCKRLRFSGTLGLALSLMASTSEACLFPWCWGWGGHSHQSFSCCGLFGHGGYTAAYAPSYNYAPSYQYAPSCDPCGTGCGSCGSCGTCGTGGYSLNNAWSGTCPSGDCGIPSSGGQDSFSSPYSGEPVTPPSSPTPSRATPPQTYREEAPDDGFRPPQPIEGTNDGGLFPPMDGASGSASPSEIAPAGGEAPDSQIERSDGFQFDTFKIPARDRADEDADADEADPPDERAGEESRVIEPLQIDAVAFVATTPQRQRAHYRAIFRTPSVARTHVPSQSNWEPIPDIPSLANAGK